MIRPDDKALCMAILGGGPAGATLATHLAERGLRVALFDTGRKPGLLVGESLVPAIIPMLRRLGIEQRVAAMGVKKPGVSFHWPDLPARHLNFEAVDRRLPQYAYNVPRPDFDDLLLQRALEAGVKPIRQRAEIENDPAEQNAYAGTSHNTSTRQSRRRCASLRTRWPQRQRSAAGNRT